MSSFFPFFIFFFNLRTSYKCIFKSHPLRYIMFQGMILAFQRFFHSVFMLRATGTIYQMIWGRTMKHFLTLAFDYIVLSLKFYLVNDPLRCCYWNFFDKSNDFSLFHCTFPLSICTCMIISIFSHIITSKNTKKKTYKETLLRKRHRAYAVAYWLYRKHILLLIVSSELQYQQTTKRKVKETIVELQSDSLSM